MFSIFRKKKHLKQPSCSSQVKETLPDSAVDNNMSVLPSIVIDNLSLRPLGSNSRALPTYSGSEGSLEQAQPVTQNPHVKNRKPSDSDFSNEQLSNNTVFSSNVDPSGSQVSENSIRIPRPTEKYCIGTNGEKKYYEFLDTPYPSFVKRSLAPDEYFVVNGKTILPLWAKERIENEAATMKFVQTHTTIPIPVVRCAFEDKGRFYLIMDHVPGITLAEVPDDKKAIALAELDSYLEQMHALKSKSMGGVAGCACLPYRLAREMPREIVRFREADTPEFVLCHNDLSQYNIIVDEKTFKINAIIEWEYAGFYPVEFEGAFWLRPGPSVALDFEVNDVAKLLQVVEKCKV